MTAPSLALITCLHRPGDRLGTLLERLEATRGGLAEIIVVLDGVSDDERQRVAAWADGRDEVTVLVAPPPHGVARARNLALRAVGSDYVWFVDDDDRWTPDAVDRIVAALGDRPDLLVFRAEYRHDPDRPGRIADGLDADRAGAGDDALSEFIAGRLHGFLWSKVVARRLWGVDPFPALSSQSDVVGVAAVLARAQTVRFIPHVLYTYVRRPGSITRSSTQRLANLRRAHGLVVASIAERVDRARLDAFTAWFYCEAVVRTTARLRIPAPDARLELAEARLTARRLDLAPLARRRPATAALLALMRVDPAVAVGAARAGYATLDAARCARARLVPHAQSAPSPRKDPRP